jgi:hypothetical protein
MIICRLAGGLGNQVFQLGVSLLLAEKSGIQKIILDDSALGLYEVKRVNELLNFFDLDKLNIQIEFKHMYITRLRLPKIFTFRFNKFFLIGDKNFEVIVKNPNKHFLLLDGYFQWTLSQENFNDIVNILKNIFISKYAKVNNNRVCIVHIRGGDFVKLGWNIITPVEYYVKAMDTMAKEHGVEKFVIVTDDKKYSGDIVNKVDYSCTFQSSSMFDDFHTIGTYPFRILSSSTFALWASILGNNQGGIVIAPNYWFPNKKREVLIENEVRINL